MKGLTILTVLLLSGYKITSTNALAVGDKCTNNGAVAPSALQNTQFYFCSGGIVYLGTCTNSRIFDQTTATCTYSSGSSTGTVSCVGNDYATYPYPGNTNYYYYCLNNQALVIQCPIGYYYSATTKACANGSESGSGNSCPSNSITALADPSGNCSNFILCVNGVANMQSCPSGYYFQPSTLNCGTTIPSNCNTIVTPAPETTTCTQNGQMQPVASNCQVYNYCLNSVWTTISCPANYYFNPTTLTCGPARPSTCITTIGTGSSSTVNCSSTPNGQFADSTNCQKYILCVNGTSISASCPTGYYYNAAIRACGTSVPSTCS